MSNGGTNFGVDMFEILPSMVREQIRVVKRTKGDVDY